MSGLTTHVLDLAVGLPAAGVCVRLFQRLDEGDTLLTETKTDGDGRARLLDGEAMTAGPYRLTFDIGAHFGRSGGLSDDPPFLDIVTIDFGVADPARHHHVPLLVSPYGYSTYRGS